MIQYKIKESEIEAVYYRPQLGGGFVISDIINISLDGEDAKTKLQVIELVESLTDDGLLYTDIEDIEINRNDENQNISLPVFIYKYGHIANINLEITKNRSLKESFEINKEKVLTKIISVLFERYNQAEIDLNYYNLME